jgi:hypothetical protein
MINAAHALSAVAFGNGAVPVPGLGTGPMDDADVAAAGEGEVEAIDAVSSPT